MKKEKENTLTTEMSWNTFWPARLWTESQQLVSTLVLFTPRLNNLHVCHGRRLQTAWITALQPDNWQTQWLWPGWLWCKALQGSGYSKWSLNLKKRAPVSPSEWFVMFFYGENRDWAFLHQACCCLFRGFIAFTFRHTHTHTFYCVTSTEGNSDSTSSALCVLQLQWSTNKQLSVPERGGSDSVWYGFCTASHRISIIFMGSDKSGASPHVKSAVSKIFTMKRLELEVFTVSSI